MSALLLPFEALWLSDPEEEAKVVCPKSDSTSDWSCVDDAAVVQQMSANRSSARSKSLRMSALHTLVASSWAARTGSSCWGRRADSIVVSLDDPAAERSAFLSELLVEGLPGCGLARTGRPLDVINAGMMT